MCATTLGFDFAILGRRRHDESCEQPLRRLRDLVDRLQEHGLVRLGWRSVAADLPDVLQRSVSHLSYGGGRLVVPTNCATRLLKS